jgi:nicotinamidase-related amidase
MAVNPKTKDWLNAIAEFNTHKMRLRESKSALLVIDMQNFFVHPRSRAFEPIDPGVLHNVKHLIESFRKAGRPVIYTRHVHKADGSDAGILGWWWDSMVIEGTWGSEIHKDIKPLPTEKVVTKHRYSAFYNTDLEITLRCLKIEDIVITGVMTNFCCESTARDAFCRDFRVFFVADANGTAHEAMHVGTLLNLAYGFAYVTTTDNITHQLRS